MNYFIETLPIDGPGFPARQPVVMQTTPQPTNAYYCKSFAVEQDVFEQNTPSIFQVCPSTFGFVSGPNVFEDIKEGDLIKVTEITDAAVKRTVFIGYVLGVAISYTFEGGYNINLAAGTLLSHWMRQLVINDAADMTYLGQTLIDASSNKVQLSALLGWFIKQSIVGFAVAQNAVPTQNYQGVNVPVIVKNGDQIPLHFNDTLWAYAAMNMTRYSCITNILYPYQRIIYQQANGEIVITPLDPTNQSSFAFSDNYVSQSNPQFTPFKQMFFNREAAMVPNRSVASMVQFGFTPPTEDADPNVISVSTPSSTYFSRCAELLATGYFEQSEMDIHAITDAMITDPTLITYISNIKYYQNSVPDNASQKLTIAGLYSSRYLSEQLQQESNLTFLTPRTSNQQYDLPLGQMISVALKQATDINSWFCYRTKLSFDIANGTLLTINCCKPYTHTSIWVNNTKADA